VKGVELPINVIVIVVICLVVLLAIIALFFGVWTPGKTSITLEAAKSNACQMLVSMSCNSYSQDISIRDFDANKNGNLSDAGNPSIIADTNGNWNYNDNCGSGVKSGDNLASLCICYYNRQNDNDCKNLCGCTS
jgi:hypothetical protein